MVTRTLHVFATTFVPMLLMATLCLPARCRQTPSARANDSSTTAADAFHNVNSLASQQSTSTESEPAHSGAQVSSAAPDDSGTQQDSPPAATTPPPALAQQAEPSPEYVLQAGDEVEVHVFNLPELSQKLRIRPDGRISVMLLHEMVAAGHTVPALTDAIRKGYSTKFRNPQVTVAVTSFVNQNVYIGGEVNQPRLIPLNGKLSAAAAIFYAGGLKSTAKTKEIIILRNSGNNTAQVTRLNLEAVLTKGAPDVQLQPFDVIYVPKSRIARLDQFVDQYFKMLQPIALNLGFSYLLGGQNVQVSIP